MKLKIVLSILLFIFCSISDFSQEIGYPIPQDEYVVKSVKTEKKLFYQIVKNGNKFGYLDKKNRDTIVPTIFDSIYHVGQNYLILISKNKGSLFSIKEKKVIFSSNEQEFDDLLLYDQSTGKTKKYFKFSKGDKIGLIDTLGQITLKPKYDSLDTKSFSDGSKNFIIISSINQNKGFIFLNDSIIEIEAKYEKITPFNNFFAGQNNDKTFDLFDKYGNVYYRKAFKISNDIYRFNNLGKISIFAAENKKIGVFSLINKEFIIPPKYDEIQELNDTLFQVKLNNKKGIINHFDKTIIPIEYDLIYQLYDGILKGKKGTIFSFVNLRNEILIDSLSKFDDLLDNNLPLRTNSKIKVYNQNYLVGLIDKNSKTLLIPCKYEDIVEVKSRSFIFKENQKFGLIDSLLQICVPAEYDNLTFLFPNRKETTNLLIAEKNGKKGLINDKNELLLDFIYDEIEYNNLHIKLKIKSCYKLATFKGKIFKQEFNHIGSYMKGTCFVVKNNKFYEIDSKCNIIKNLKNEFFGFNEIDSIVHEFQKIIKDTTSLEFKEFCSKLSTDKRTAEIANQYQIKINEYWSNLNDYILFFEHTKEQIIKNTNQITGKIIEVRKISESKEFQHINDEYFLTRKNVKIIIIAENGIFNAYFDLVNYDGFYKLHKIRIFRV